MSEKDKKPPKKELDKIPGDDTSKTIKQEIGDG